MEADERLEEAMETTSSLLTNVMEEVGMGLAPLGEEQAEIAHRPWPAAFFAPNPLLV